MEDKLKILCLHGYRQDASGFKSKLGSFRKIVNKYAEFAFLEAEHLAPTEQEQGGSQRSWWFNKDDGSFKGTNKDGPAKGFEESVRLVERFWTEQGPFDGLLGFSQGGCFVGLLCALAEQRKTTIRPKFAIICAGFKSGSLCHLNNYHESVTISIPTLHIYGDGDQIIPKEMSAALADHYENKEVVIHAGGHYFPASAEQKKTYLHFFQDRLLEKLEAKELAEAAPGNTIELENGAPSSDTDDE